MYISNRNNRVPLDTLIFIIHVPGSIELDQVIKVLFGTASFTGGGVIGFLLDNIVPGKCSLNFHLKIILNCIYTFINTSNH